MSISTIEEYQAGTQAVPDSFKRWHLRGAGLESLSEEEVGLPQIQPDELLVRHDACGICFSDIKIINLGPNHPRLIGRDMVNDPVVMGHEVALTIVKVGDAIADKFKVGERFIVQADVYYKGANLAYGYILKGGMAQYGVVGEEVLRGDEGSYLLPLKDDTGYVEAALVEPWACVVAAYEYPFRKSLKSGGALLVVGVGSEVNRSGLEDFIQSCGAQPSNVEVVDVFGDVATTISEHVGERKFDDIVVTGSPTAADITAISAHLNKLGVMNLAVTDLPEGSVTLDIGRIHYDQLLYVGGVSQNGVAGAASAYSANARGDLKSGGTTWFIGAGGPMGQMHVQRAVMSDNPPGVIVVSDVSDERLARITDRFGEQAKARGVNIVLVNPQALGDEGYKAKLNEIGPFDDIVCMVPVASVVAETAPYLAEDGIYNIFAGVAKGVTADLDLATILRKRQRFVGTSGSSIADLQHTLDLVESDKLSTNSSLAAIGGLNAFRDGLSAVKAGAFPGKTVIFPHIEDLPLTSLDELKDRLPNVYAKLQDGKFWTKEAEEELLKEGLAQ